MLQWSAFDWELRIRNILEEMTSTHYVALQESDAMLGGRKIRENTIPLEILQDNQACITTVTTMVTPWRSRHYAIRAAWVRDAVTFENVKVRYQKGSCIVADALTKILGSVKLKEAQTKLCLEVVD